MIGVFACSTEPRASTSASVARELASLSRQLRSSCSLIRRSSGVSTARGSHDALMRGGWSGSFGRKAIASSRCGGRLSPRGRPPLEPGERSLQTPTEYSVTDAAQEVTIVEHAFDLTGHVSLVAGGNGGIGLGIARGLADAG